MSENRVAIIILNWNSPGVTIDCLRSLLSIEYQNYIIYLVDNGSVDGSINLIKEEIVTDKLRCVELKSNFGFTGGNNIGVAIATKECDPDYFLLLNNDTIVDKKFLTFLVESFVQNGELGVVVPKIFFYGDQKEYIYYAGGYINLISGLGEHYHWKRKDDPSTEISREISFANGCSMLIKKEVIKQIKLFDDSFFANIEDVDFSYRVTKAGYKIFYNPLAFLWHREGYTSKKNMGHWFRIYLTTRNVILFQRKRFSFFGFVLFAAYFSFRWVLYMTLKLLFSKDFISIKSIYYGIVDGFSVNKRLRFVKRPATVDFLDI